MNQLKMASQTTFCGRVVSTLWVLLALPAAAVEYERATPSRPPLPAPETITVPATAFQPVTNDARYDVSQGFLVNLAGYANFRRRISLPSGALIQKLELIATVPAGTGGIGLGLAWQDPRDRTWQWVTQVSDVVSRRESATSWANFTPEHYVSANRIYWLDVYMSPVGAGENPGALRFYSARITYVRAAWL